MISVCMITYKQAKFIKDAVQGVLMQKKEFDIELIIADDCSPDETEKIVAEIIKSHPNGHWIKYTRHNQNKGMMNNFIWALQQCKGDYIALCEGDDYWIDKEKLKKQVNILNTNGSCSFTFHQAIRIFDVQRQYEIYPIFKNHIMDSVSFFKFSTIPMASVLFRNKFSFNCPNSHIQPDFLLLCKLMSIGNAYFLPEVMSVYRKHVNGISYNNQSFNYLKRRVSCLSVESKAKEFTPEVRKEIKRMFRSHAKQLTSNYRKRLTFLSVLKYKYQILTVR
jgi:glycosyltransferase involved in cell wall biosynthesis